METFRQNIQEMIAERESTLFEIERVLFTHRYKLSKTHIDIFSTQSISMIYAIWEGFIQQAFQKYIAYLNNSNTSFNDFNDRIKVFHIENCFKQFNEYPKDTAKKVKFYENLQNFYAIGQHDIYHAINTQSNLGFDILNIILNTFCLKEFPEYWEEYKHPKPNLKESLKTFLRYRNSVAHGGDISAEETVTQEAFSRYRKLIVDLMYGVNDKMLDGIENKTYLK